MLPGNMLTLISVHLACSTSWTFLKSTFWVDHTANFHSPQLCCQHLLVFSTISKCLGQKDHTYSQKHKEKYEQHHDLLEILKNVGYADIQLHLLIFGSI